jgi:hypothetical protein
MQDITEAHGLLHADQAATAWRRRPEALGESEIFRALLRVGFGRV